MAKQQSYFLQFEDENYVVVSKSAGVLVIPDRYNDDLHNLKTMLQDRFGEIFVVHRIDRGTSGLIVFAKNAEAHQHLSLQFENRLIEKEYTAIVNGTFHKQTGTIETLIARDESKKGKMKTVRTKGKSAISHYEVEEQFLNFALIKVRIESGRTHQVRVHMASIGYPLVGDPKYGGQAELSIGDLKRRVSGSSVRPLIARPALHASRLSFKSVDGNMLSFESDPPKDIRATLHQLRKWKAMR